MAYLNVVEGFCGSDNYQHEQLCWFTPDYSSLWQGVREFPRLDARPDPALRELHEPDLTQARLRRRLPQSSPPPAQVQATQPR